MEAARQAFVIRAPTNRGFRLLPCSPSYDGAPRGWREGNINETERNETELDEPGFGSNGCFSGKDGSSP
eukprot:CAMPEP_0201129734 /NCGR_PEP_ID=MMETSP0850-20130426/37894_1 /ASSEMBLY_ACC=CAM_ASM_000622 /TAXON_ID=183588 /ORGANISM="Pseudo-nitzschia fraudulenta, Strain WWA7" /LENGTH=68 /DNA_ID=CAMNT_0047399301 /DNA_START=589 /DNA_END=792 /DNA_ORIENTATION=-